MTDSFAVQQWVLGTPELVGESLQIAPLKLENGTLLVQPAKHVSVRLI